jgi:Ser/Thr protein kinase RdoA (MazF antagonist)
LQHFQDAFPHRQSLIHADLHFRNVLLTAHDLAAIDFDDCGFGFHAYDLAVPLVSVQARLGAKRKREFPRFAAALVEGYVSEKRWDENDETILPYLITARKLVFIGWLASRSDNPGLRKYFNGAVAGTVKHIRREHGVA